jgi:hypothetical protein
MKPPFSEPGRARVAWWGDLATLPRGGILQEHAGPIVIARLSEGRYVEREPRIPELPASLPPLTRSPDRPGEWTFATPPPARAVSGLRVSAGSQGVFGCRWIGSRGTRETRGSLPGLGGEARAIVSAPEDFDWLADPMVLGVRFEGVDPSGVEPLRELAEITIATPRRRARIPVGGLPDITFVPPPQPRSQEYRLTVEFAISHDERPLMISEEPAFILQDRGGGTLAYDVTRQRTSRFVGSSEIDAETFFGRRLGDALRASGSGLLPLSIRVEGFDPASGAVECRSDWRICFLENR